MYILISYKVITKVLLIVNITVNINNRRWKFLCYLKVTCLVIIKNDNFDRTNYQF